MSLTEDLDRMIRLAQTLVKAPPYYTATERDFSTTGAVLAAVLGIVLGVFAKRRGLSWAPLLFGTLSVASFIGYYELYSASEVLTEQIVLRFVLSASVTASITSTLTPMKQDDGGSGDGEGGSSGNNDSTEPAI